MDIYGAKFQEHWDIVYSVIYHFPTHWIQFQLFILYKSACLRKIFLGRLLSIRVFSTEGHCGLIVSLCGWTLPRHVINLVVNSKRWWLIWLKANNLIVLVEFLPKFTSNNLLQIMVSRRIIKLCALKDRSDWIVISNCVLARIRFVDNFKFFKVKNRKCPSFSFLRV